jgi:hypothetical protein
MPPKISNETLRKLQPKLRMITDGDTTVNVIRSERCAALAIEKTSLLRAIEPVRGPDAVPVTLRQFKKKPRAPALKKITPDVLANVFVYLRDPASDPPNCGGRPNSRSGQIVQVQTTLNDIPRLAADPNVAFVEIAEPLEAPSPTLAELRPDPPSLTLRRFGKPAKHNFGEDVIVGIIDVQGFDFAHSDFMENGKTRFVRIWDQGGDGRPSPETVGQFSYGAEFTDTHMNAAIKASPQLGLPATDIEKQSQTVEGSHGTHVASIAAGNRGVCRKATIAAVLVSLAERGRGPPILVLRLEPARRRG